MVTAEKRHLVFMALAAAVAQLLLSGSAIAADDAAPKIIDCRVGFGDHYKVGHWTPIWVDVSGEVAGKALHIDVTTADCDGVDVTGTITLPTASESVAGVWPALMYAKMGRLDGSIRVTLRAEQEVLDRREIRPGENSTGEPGIKALSATSELIVHVGPDAIGLAEALPDRDATDAGATRNIVAVSGADALPRDWFGYEGVNVLVLSAGDGALCRSLAADKQRLAALVQWVEMGGRLVFLCGRSASDLLVEGAPLASLAPGRFVAIGRMTESSALKHYAQSEVEIIAPGSRSDLQVAQLADVAGRVELYGAGASQLPLVIRAPRGLGEVTFVGVDLDVAPLADWSGRAGFLRALLKPLTANAEGSDSSRNLVTTGYDDLSGALRQRLGQAFAGVRPISFRSVVGLSILYLLVLGPLDYWIVRKWVRRPSLAWITFPLILLLFGLGALALARSRDATPRPSVNQMELVDIDLSAGLARGTYWGTLYSPQARRFDVEFAAQSPDGDPAAVESLLSWQGLAGAGIGGMRGAGPDFSNIATGYRIASNKELAGVPVLTAATKSLLARWKAPVARTIAARLNDDQGMLAGTITNETGLTLRDARLLYGAWAYRLKDIEPGATRDLNEQIAPISVRTLLTGLALGSASGGALGSERATMPAEQATAVELLNTMMFYNAAGGAGFAGLPLRYQSFCDLSRLLDLGRAVLVAEVSAPGSRLLDGETADPLADRDGGASVTIYRFVLPVTKSNQ